MPIIALGNKVIQHGAKIRTDEPHRDNQANGGSQGSVASAIGCNARAMP